MVVKQEAIEWAKRAKAAFEESIAVKALCIEKCIPELVNIAKTIVEAIQKGNTLFLCGNGGSLADAQHLAGELLIRLRPHVNRQALPALCLATDMSSVTACGNDYGFEQIFSRSLAGLAKQGDIVLGISTSGNSRNVIKAFETAKNLGVQSIGFLGCGGGSMLQHCDLAFIVPSSVTARVQEAHITAGHILMEMIEDMLDENNYLQKLP